MGKIYLRSVFRIGTIIRLTVLIVGLIGTSVKVLGQSPGDFQTKNTSGNWSDFNAWNIRDVGNIAWIAAISGQIPNATTDVFIQALHNISIDNATAACKTINANAANSTKISFSSASAILSVYGNMIFASGGHNIFGSWIAGAKFVFAGSAAQTTTALSASSTFINLEINKSINSISTDGDLQFSNALNVLSGSLIIGNAKEIRGTSNLSNISIQTLGTLTLLSGATSIRVGASGISPIGKVTVNGTFNINTTSSYGINVTSLDLEDNGTTGGIVNVSTTSGGGVISANSGGLSIKNNAFLNIISNCKTTWIAPSTFLNIEAGGNLIISNPSFVLPSNYSFLGTVNYNNGTQSIAAATSYTNLTLESVATPADKNFTSGLNITKDLLIGGNGVLIGSTNTINIGGNWKSYATSGFTENSSTVDFNGSSMQVIITVGGEDFFLIKKSGSGTLTLNSNVTATGGAGSGLNISAGNIDAGTNTLSGAGTSTLTMSGGILKLAKLTTLPEFTGNYALSAGTIELNGAGAQILKSGEAYRNLTFSNFTNTTILSDPASINGTVYITGSALLDIGSSNGFGDVNTNLTMDGGRFKMSGSSSAKPNIDGTFSLTGGFIEFAGSSGGAQPIKGKNNNNSSNIIYKNIEITGSNVGTSNENIFLNKTAGSFTVKTGATYTPNSKSIVSEHNVNTSVVTVENGAFFKTGNNKGFSGTTYTVPSNSSIDLNISFINLNAGSTVDYSNSSVDQEISNQLPYQNFTISGSTIKKAPALLSILGNFKRNAGIFNPNAGLVSFDGTTSQTFSSVSGGTNFYALKINNSVGVILNSDTLNLIDSLVLTSNSKLIFGTGNVALKSTTNKTAHVSAIPASANINYSGAGRFMIERYLFAKKSWRLLATPVQNDGLTITNSWREGILGATNTTATGYGTQITGPASSLGMDTMTQRGSLKWYDKSLNNYREITNTADAIARPEGYYLFVRGDRSKTIAAAGNETTLRIKGKILTGTQSAFAVTDFASFGNPYPSAIDFRSVTKNTIVNGFIAWDPNRPGFYGVGGYDTYTYNSSTGHYVNTPFGNYRDTIQSGEAVFIQSLTSGSIVIKEDDKVGGSRNVSRAKESYRLGASEPTLEINLYAKNTNSDELLTDGVKLNFDPKLQNTVDNDDTRKINNSGENLSIKKEYYNLVVEGHAPLKITDSIFLNLTNTRIAPYHFEIDPSVLGNLPLNAFLKDKFLGTETSVSLTGVTNVNFSITNEAASQVADRFMIVFKQAIPNGQLTGNFISIAVNKNADKTNTIKWSYSNESNIAYYIVERSKNGTVFTGIGNKNAGNLSNIGSYIFIDSLNVFGNNYYRIKATSTTGLVQYSAIVKVVENDSKPLFVVQPNPVLNKTLHINFEKLRGDYILKLIAKQGATVFSKQINISSVKEVKNIVLDDSVAAGVYELVLVDSKGKKLLQTIFIK